MNRTYIISTFITAFLLLCLKLSDLSKLGTFDILEIVFYSAVIIFMIYYYVKIDVARKKEKVS